MCESIRPGMTVRPLRSIVRVRGPARFRMSAERPTAMMRPSRMASAWCVENAASTASTLPFTRIVSACCADVGAARTSIITKARATMRMRAPILGSRKPSPLDSRSGCPERSRRAGFRSETQAAGDCKAKIVTEERLVMDVAISIEHRTGIFHQPIPCVNPDERALAHRDVHAAAQVERHQRAARRGLAGERWRKNRNAGEWFGRRLHAQESRTHPHERVDAAQPGADGGAEQPFHAGAAERRRIGKVAGIMRDLCFEDNKRGGLPPEAATDARVRRVELARERN